jgi:signal transduction histidine kinase/CheY-like chemotaxis protein
VNGTHQFPLVALSILIAICASYTALTLAGRVSVARGRARLAWLLGGSVALGSGIWSMHFVAMLAFHLPVPIAYDVPLVTLSWLAAVGASAFALFVASRSSVGKVRLGAAGTCLGLAVVTMHYTGMAAVRVQANLNYDVVLVGVSVLIAITASTVALLLFIWLRNDNTRRGRSLRAAAAVVMGLAIAGMHYTAMAAAQFTDVGALAHVHEGMLVGSSGLAVPVVMGAFVILTLTLAGSVTDHWVRMKLASAEAAEAASRAKSEFLSRMSHELRTPLNAILGFGQLTELEAVTPSQKENADQILKAGRHLLHLINEVLDITGIESGRMHLSVEPVDVREAVQEVCDLVRPLAAPRRIDLRIEPSAGECFVHADRQRLKQVLLNIVANAVKYNRDGGMARVRCEATPDDRVRIVVVDTGTGIDPTRMHRLFTAFDRLGAEQTGVEGTGLGLALSKRLTEAMNGTLGVQSAPGKGTSFWVELPAAQSPLQRLPDLDLRTPAHLPAIVTPGKRFRILYVEDNLSNLTLVQRILARRQDIELIPAMQGGLALELARSHRPDLVLLDLHLPDMSGEEVLTQLRRTPDCRGIPIVVLSADATQGQVDRLLGMGARAYVTKPFDVKPFIRIVDDALELEEAA